MSAVIGSAVSARLLFRSEVMPAFVAAGQSCNNFNGLCTGTGACMAATDTHLSSYLSGQLLDWIVTYWFAGVLAPLRVTHDVQVHPVRNCPVPFYCRLPDALDLWQEGSCLSKTLLC